MTNGRGVEEALGRVRKFEDELRSIGVKIEVDVRGVNAESHEYGSHEIVACALCAAYDRGFEEGGRKGSREQTERFQGALNRMLDRS